MLDAIHPTNQSRVTGLVDQIMAESGTKGTIGPDTRLVDAGLTSMDMVNLMLAVEAEFDIMIPPGEITPSNFQSIASIENLVSRVCAKAA